MSLNFLDFCINAMLNILLTTLIQVLFCLLYHRWTTRQQQNRIERAIPPQNRRINQRAASRQRNPVRRVSHPRTQTRVRARSLSPEQFGRILIPSVEEVKGAQICSICLSELDENQPLRKLVCNHIFHENCLFDWVGRQEASCPICRRNLMNAY